jgi:predicted Zn-dependent protease
MTFKEIAHAIMASSAADETEVVYRRHDESLTRFANNHIHQNVTETDHEIAVRCVSGSRSGIAVSNIVHPENLHRLAQLALELAKQQPENPDFKGLPGPSLIVETRAFDRAAAECSPAYRANGVGIVCRQASEAGYNAAGSMTTGTAMVGVANSKGVFGQYESTLVDASTVVMSSTSSGWAQASGWKLDSVDWEHLAEEAIRKARMGENPQECDPGEYTVILDHYATADLLEMMGMDGMSALAFQEERSWLNGRLGERILAENVTILDDGHDDAGIPIPFDEEGQPKHVVPIVNAGVCSGMVHDSFTAGRQAGAVSTGHATALSPTERPGPLPRNLFMRGGTSNVDEMIASTKNGLYITRFWYTRTVHPRDVVVTGMTRDGTFLVRDGEIAGPVKSMRFTQSYLAALANTLAIGSACKTVRNENAAFHVPAVKLERFRFTGATK